MERIKNCELRDRLVFAVLVPVLLYKLVEIPPLGGTWNCEDQSIRFKYVGDSVSTKLLLLGILVPITLIIFITECLHKAGHGVLPMLKSSLITTSTIYTKYFIYLTGNIFVNILLKTATAVPRPHFIDSCVPDWGRVNCSANGGNVIFSPSLCLSQDSDSHSLLDAMKSFPSGHAQLAAFTAAFLIVYFQKRVSLSVSHLLRYWLQLVVTLLATLTATSRLLDHRHHLSDVLVGSLLGLVLGGLGAMDTLENITTIKEEGTGEQEKNKQTQNKFVKQKRPSKMRLLSSDFGSVMEAERELRAANPNPAC